MVQDSGVYRSLDDSGNLSSDVYRRDESGAIVSSGESYVVINGRGYVAGPTSGGSFSSVDIDHPPSGYGGSLRSWRYGGYQEYVSQVQASQPAPVQPSAQKEVTVEDLQKQGGTYVPIGQKAFEVTKDSKFAVDVAQGKPSYSLDATTQYVRDRNDNKIGSKSGTIGVNGRQVTRYNIVSPNDLKNVSPAYEKKLKTQNPFSNPSSFGSEVMMIDRSGKEVSSGVYVPPTKVVSAEVSDTSSSAGLNFTPAVGFSSVEGGEGYVQFSPMVRKEEVGYRRENFGEKFNFFVNNLNNRDDKRIGAKIQNAIIYMGVKRVVGVGKGVFSAGKELIGSSYDLYNKDVPRIIPHTYEFGKYVLSPGGARADLYNFGERLRTDPTGALGSAAELSGEFRGFGGTVGFAKDISVGKGLKIGEFRLPSAKQAIEENVGYGVEIKSPIIGVQSPISVYNGEVSFKSPIVLKNLGVQSPISVEKVMKVENTGVKFKPVFTEPISNKELMTFVDKPVTALHVTNNPMALQSIQKGEFITVGNSNMAGKRGEYDLLHFYVSLPEWVKPVDVAGSSSSKLISSSKVDTYLSEEKTSILGLKTRKTKAYTRYDRQPQAYLAYAGIGAVESSGYRFGFGGNKIYALEYKDTFSDVVGGEKNIVRASLKQARESGRLQFPVENKLLGSIEKQGVYPSSFKSKFTDEVLPGTQMTVKNKKYATYVETPEGYAKVRVFSAKASRIKSEEKARDVLGDNNVNKLEISSEYYKDYKKVTPSDVLKYSKPLSSAKIKSSYVGRISSIKKNMSSINPSSSSSKINSSKINQKSSMNYSNSSKLNSLIIKSSSSRVSSSNSLSELKSGGDYISTKIISNDSRRDKSKLKPITKSFTLKPFKQLKVYTPSATAALFGIKGKKSSKAEIKSGLGFRPIVK